jgi:hypothetical protein
MAAYLMSMKPLLRLALVYMHCSRDGSRNKFRWGFLLLLEVGTLNPKTEPNPNNPNYRSIRVTGFGFGLDKFII